MQKRLTPTRSSRQQLIQNKRPQRILRSRLAKKLIERPPSSLRRRKHVDDVLQFRIARRHVNNQAGIHNSNATAFT
jgi:hypothetical protein